MAEIAESLELVIGSDGNVALLVDGEEFPWTILGDNLQLRADVNGVPYVSLDIAAKSVTARFAQADELLQRVESVPVESPMKKVGHRFFGGNFSGLPDYVLAVERLGGDDHEQSFLVRKKDNPEVWAWSLGPDSYDLPQYGETWEQWMRTFADYEYAVAKVAEDLSE